MRELIRQSSASVSSDQMRRICRVDERGMGPRVARRGGERGGRVSDAAKMMMNARASSRVESETGARDRESDQGGSEAHARQGCQSTLSASSR